jgi:uncharacterized membrane protein YphA (DoxX/SURF4 family)
MTLLEPPIDRAPAARPGYARGLLFRFGFLYWALFCVMLLGQDVEEYPWLPKPLSAAWHAAMRWVGETLLAIPHVATAITGSGDRTVDWVGLLCVAVLALAGSLAWSLLDRERRHDARLRELLRVIVRYTLAFIVLSYGLMKIYDAQFPAPGSGRLLERYGDSSPMGLVWAFMGASRPYVIFAGVAETAGALLLLSRRTTALGALLLAIVLTNVALLNLCYDVPLKLNAVHFVAMCVFLLLPELRPLADVLVFRRPTQPRADRLALTGRARIASRVAKYAAIAVVLITTMRQASEQSAPPPSAWYDGNWTVTSFVRDGVPVPARLDDATRWERLRFQALDRGQYVRWHNMDRSHSDLYDVQVDDARGTMRFTPDTEIEPPKHPIPPLTFTFTHHGDDLTMTGTVDGHALAVTLRRLDTSEMLLVSRGFHWISEEPYNR